MSATNITNIVLPSVAKVSLIFRWTETLLYGVSCVVYGLCMFVLLRERQAISSRWVLVMTSTVLFLLATAHVGVSLAQLLEAFVYAPPGDPGYADIYFLTFTNPMPTLQNALFVALNLVQDLVLIWRLYVVFNRDWRVIVLPIILEAATLAAGTAGAIILARPSKNATQLLSITLASSVLNLAVNVSVTIAIALRLWWMGRVVSSVRRRRTPYASSIWVIVESGAVMVGAIIVQLCLYIKSAGGDDPIFDALSLGWIMVTSQLAAITPLLIVVRVGLGLTHGLPCAYQSVITSQAHISVTVTSYREMGFPRIPSLQTFFGDEKFDWHDLSTLRVDEVGTTVAQPKLWGEE